MRKRLAGLLVAAVAVGLTVPAATQASESECNNGNEPVVFVKLQGQPLSLGNVRLLCVQS